MLRLVRSGSTFALLRRSPGQRWVLQHAYSRTDLPTTLQVGIDAQSGFDTRASVDLVATVDWIRFAETGIPAAQRGAPARSLLPYLTR